MTKELILLRGLPGAGKTSLAKTLGGRYFEADMYFEHPIRGYEFDPFKLKDAHQWCREAVDAAMSNCYHNAKEDVRLVVSNTFTTDSEMSPYIEMAQVYGFRLITLIVENRHGNKSVHDVPEETMDKMRKRFTVQL